MAGGGDIGVFDYTGRFLMSCIDVIAKKRDGFALSREDLDAFVFLPFDLRETV